jgi:hypothetical protein
MIGTRNGVRFKLRKRSRAGFLTFAQPGKADPDSIAAEIVEDLQAALALQLIRAFPIAHPSGFPSM